MNKLEKIAEKIRNDFDEIESILIDINRLKIKIIQISNTEELYFKAVIEKSNFFYELYIDSIQLLITQLSKLLINKYNFENKPTKPKNEDFDLEKFLKFIKANHASIIFLRPISTQKLDQCIIKLDDISRSEDFNKFKILRNKFYSHTRKNRSKFDVKFKLDKLYSIIDQLHEVFNILNLHLRNKKLAFNDLNKPKELNMIYKYLQIKEVVYTEHKNSVEIGKLTTILSIIRG